jgi:hypothetical protein
MSDYVPVPKSDPILSTAGRLVCCKAGDLVLWDSRTVHCNTPALRKPALLRGGEQLLAEASLKRIVAYVCHVPRGFATEATVARRQDAFRSRTGSTHWPQHLTLGAPGEVYGLDGQSLEDAPRAVQRLVGEPESMQSLVSGRDWEAEGTSAAGAVSTLSAPPKGKKKSVFQPSAEAMAAMESDPAAVRQMLLMMVGQERIDQFLEMAQHSPELAGEGGGLSTAIDEGAIED